MRTASLLSISFLLLWGTASLSADPATINKYSKGLGINLGVASGTGLSYRELTLASGWQVTGILFKDPTGLSQSLLFSAGVGYLKPLGAFSIFEWLDTVPYLQASLTTSGGSLLDGKAKSLNGECLASVSYGLEWLLWNHLSFNLEVAQSAGFVLAPGRAANWSADFAALVSPQFALYFRY